MAVKGIPVVIAENRQGFPVIPVEANAPLATVAENGFGTPIVLVPSNGTPMIVQGWVPTEPAAFSRHMWSITPGDGELTINILALPRDGFDPITDIEYRVDGGSWESSGGIVTFVISPLVNDQEYEIELRAVNGIGEGPASAPKQGTPENAPP